MFGEDIRAESVPDINRVTRTKKKTNGQHLTMYSKLMLGAGRFLGDMNEEGCSHNWNCRCFDTDRTGR